MILDFSVSIESIGEPLENPLLPQSALRVRLVLRLSFTLRIEPFLGLSQSVAVFR